MEKTCPPDRVRCAFARMGAVQMNGVRRDNTHTRR